MKVHSFFNLRARRGKGDQRHEFFKNVAKLRYMGMTQR